MDDKHLQNRLKKYFYKAHELLIITESSSQVDENSDLKNADIIRIQGFSQSLMHQVLKMNKELRLLQEKRDELRSVMQGLPNLAVQVEGEQAVLEPVISSCNVAKFKAVRDDFLSAV